MNLNTYLKIKICAFDLLKNIRNKISNDDFEYLIRITNLYLSYKVITKKDKKLWLKCFKTRVDNKLLIETLIKTAIEKEQKVAEYLLDFKENPQYRTYSIIKEQIIEPKIYRDFLKYY